MTHERPGHKIVERIRKLHAKAESAKQIGSEAEAETFAAAVQAMLRKHKLEMSDLEVKQQNQDDPVKMHEFWAEQYGFKRKRKRQLWTTALATAVAEAHFCEVIHIRQSDSFFLVGRRSDREVAEFMYATLRRLGEELSEKAYVKFFYECRANGDVTMARGYKANFLLGYVSRIKQRYTMEEIAFQAELRATKNQHALIRLSSEHALVQSFMDQLKDAGVTKPGTSPGGPNKDNPHGYVHGMQAGDSVNIRGTAVGQPDKRQKLAQGHKQLGAGS